jgi:CubicO group peptidase (beta-lactamase class C family)
MDSGVLAEMLDHARKRGLPVHNVLVVRHGRIVLDASFYPYDPGRPHDIASATKSIVSVLIGIAIDKGYIADAKQGVTDLLSGTSRFELDSRKSAIALEHLLTMTSGFDCGVEPGEKELAAMRRSDDWVAFALGLPLIREPGIRYAYCSCNNHLLSAVLTARTGESALAFARKHLFAPLGIEDVMWPADAHGRNHGWGDLHLHSRDFAKIAHLYLRGGRWNEKQVVSEHWVRQSIAPRVSVRDGVAYGYSWWLNTARQPAVFEAVGRGGQRAAVVPDKDLVVVFNGGGVNTDDLAPFLFQALKSDSPLAVNEANAKRLRRALNDAREPPPLRVAAPLPALARSVSGRRYVMDPNPLNLQHLSLAFSGPNDASATLRMDNREWNLPIGLDGRYRFSSSGPEGLPLATRGQWLSPREFLLDLNAVANINHFTFRMTFVGREVQIQIDEATGELTNLRVRGRPSATRASSGVARPDLHRRGRPRIAGRRRSRAGVSGRSDRRSFLHSLLHPRCEQRARLCTLLLARQDFEAYQVLRTNPKVHALDQVRHTQKYFARGVRADAERAAPRRTCSGGSFGTNLARHPRRRA